MFQLNRWSHFSLPTKLSIILLLIGVVLACVEYFRNYITPAGLPTNMTAFVKEDSMDHSQLEWLARKLEEFHVIGGHGDLVDGRILLRNEIAEVPKNEMYWTAQRLAEHVTTLGLHPEQTIFLSICRAGRGDSSFALELSKLIPNKIITSEDFIMLRNQGAIATSPVKPGARELLFPSSRLSLVEFHNGEIVDRFSKS